MATSKTKTAGEKKTATGKTSTKTTAKKPATKVTAKTTAKAPVAKKPAAPKAATPKATAAKKPAAPRARKGAPSPEQRYRMIQEAAYFMAEKDAFGGCATDYWIAAEAQIELMLRGD